LFDANRVDFLLIGGFAVGAHGAPRMTGDLDVWIARTPENASRIVAALSQFGFSGDAIAAELFLKEREIVRFGAPPLRVEIHTSISGVEFGPCHERKIDATIDGQSVPLISLEDLKANKRASGRLKDLMDLENLP
jgi:hypothetical protein